MQFLKIRLANFVKSLIQSKLANETKRIIVLSSLAARIESITDPAQEVLHKLNTILHLCRDDKALMFPMYVSNVIWGSRDRININLQKSDIRIQELKEIKEHHLSETQIQIVASLIVKIIPEYLSYASKRMMRGDIILLLKQVVGIQQNNHAMA